MAIRDEVLSLVARDPRYAQALDEMERQVADMDMAPDDLDEIIQLLETMLKHPEKYPEILDAALKDGLIEKGMMPEQMDPTFVVSLLAALYGMKDRLSKKMARGGLASAARRLAAQGRHGDTMLAHINPQEAEMLKRSGGAGSINPKTGLPEYFKLFSFLKKIAPIALAVLAPIAAPAVGAAISGGLGLGLSSAAATALGGAAVGAGTAALTGNNVLQGATMGGLSSGLGGMIGGALGLENPIAQSVVGNALAGGATGALTGKGFMSGAAQGALGGGIAGAAGQMLSPGAFQQAGQTFGNALSSGYSPGQATTSAVLAGLAKGITSSPSDQAVAQVKGSQNWLTSPQPAGQVGADLTSPSVFDMTTGYSGGLQQTAGGDLVNPSMIGNAASSFGMPAASGMSSIASSIPWGKLALGAGALMAASSLVKAPPKVKQEVAKLSPKQQEYFNRPAQVWDWDRMEKDAARANMSLGDYMARNWNTVASGAYSQPQQPTVAAATGGALSAIAKFAKGAGSGRDDTIDAKLSDGEYVIDAETVALLGDGSSDEGAKRLDEMRTAIRRQKGKALAKGKFSPNAKSPLAYIKGVA